LRIAIASVIAVTIAAALAGCGGSGAKKSAAPAMAAGRPFADSFVHRLIVVGRWQAVVGDTGPLVRRALRSFQATVKSNGVRKVLGHGVLKNDCPQNPNVGATNQCFAYRVAGGYVLPISGKQVTIRARFRLWLEYVDGHWRVLSYDYDARPH
jgi:hypothetical protein